jgi:hypothetical protein
MTGLEMLYLRFTLWRQGYRVNQFHYHSVLKTPEQNAEKLYQFMSQLDEPVVHLVAHSLGGIVLCHLFDKYEIKQAGKVVMLGSPVKGSALARHINQNVILKYVLGKSVIKGLLGDAPRWHSKRRLSVIAGTKSSGVGMLLARKEMQKQNDGTVNLNETQIEQAEEFHLVPQSHFSMLWSHAVAEKINSFLMRA